MSSRIAIKRKHVILVFLALIGTMLLRSKPYSNEMMKAATPNSKVIPPMPTACEGKEELIRILKNAGKNNVTAEECELLPTWKQVIDKYGEEPVVYGLDSCERFRALVANNETNMVRVAGLYNTGTNALARLIRLNLVPTAKNKDVPWGKHASVQYRLTNKFPPENTESPEHVLPIISVRDPYLWMQSMCRHRYYVMWNTQTQHCPNLVPTAAEQQRFHLNATFNVTYRLGQVGGSDPTDYYDSLADLWSEWNRGWMLEGGDFPRLVVRFEDVLFHVEQVFELIGKCAGLTVTKPFSHPLSAAKIADKSNDLVGAMSHYANAMDRYKGMTQDDLDYSQKALDPKLLQHLHYLPVEDKASRRQESTTRTLLS